MRKENVCSRLLKLSPAVAYTWNRYSPWGRLVYSTWFTEVASRQSRSKPPDKTGIEANPAD